MGPIDMNEPGAFAKAFKHGLDPANMDDTVGCNCDFYGYANGNWLKNNPIPAEEAAWGSFLQLRDLNLERCRDLLAGGGDGADGALPADLAALLGLCQNFYAAGMDEERAEAAAPHVALAEHFGRIDALAAEPTAEKIAGVVAELHRADACGAFFGFGSDVDNRDSAWTIGGVVQGGLGLPDRDYYFDEDKAEQREGYRQHVAAMLLHLPYYDTPAEAAEVAGRIVAFERDLASAHMTRTERRDPEKTYHPHTLAEVQEKFGGIRWQTYFDTLYGADGTDVGKLNVSQLDAIAKVGELFTAACADPADTIHYLRWQVLNHNANYLSADLVNLHFEFFGKQMSGQKMIRQRWKRVMASVESYLGEALAQLYVHRWFSGEAKPKALKIVESVRDALQERLQEVEWMEESTRAAALQKMAGFRVQIGFQDEWPDYAEFGELAGRTYVDCVNIGRRFETKRDLDRVNKATDKNRWYMTPQTVNAYYHPNYNLICFPAAILQPPFFDPDADDAVNYGSMGAVVGHEMTHGFDDQGRKFDAAGNMVDWWTASDSKDYEARVQVQVDQAAAHTVHGIHLKGKLTAGENLADLGGLRLALRALKKTLTGNEEKIDGFTPVQRFFLAWASCWRQNIREERAKQLVTLDPHGPSDFRCNGPLRNMAEFHAAFGIQEDDPMYKKPEDRVDVW